MYVYFWKVQIFFTSQVKGLKTSANSSQKGDHQPHQTGHLSKGHQKRQLLPCCNVGDTLCSRNQLFKSLRYMLNPNWKSWGLFVCSYVSLDILNVDVRKVTVNLCCCCSLWLHYIVNYSIRNGECISKLSTLRLLWNIHYMHACLYMYTSNCIRVCMYKYVYMYK